MTNSNSPTADENSSKTVSEASSRVLRHTFVYAIGAIVAKMGSLLLAPLYLNPDLLHQREYGQFVVLDATWLFAVILLSFGIRSAVPRFATQEEPIASGNVAGTAMVLAIVPSVLVLGLGLVSSLALGAGTLLPFSENALPFAIYVAMKVTTGIPLALLRTHERVRLYSLAGVIEAIVLVVASYFGLVVAEAGLTGLLYGHVFGAAAGLLTSVAFAHRFLSFKFSRKLVLPLVKYGGGILVSSLCLALMTLSDRYVIGWLIGLKAVAVYGWASRLAGTLQTLVVFTFQKTFHVVAIKIDDRDTTEKSEFIQNVFRRYVVIVGWIVVAITLGAYDLTRLLSTNTAYANGDVLMLPLCLGHMAYGVFYITANSLLVNAKTGRLATIVFSATILNLGLNFALVTAFGPLGAALATFFAFLVLAVLAAVITRRDTQIEYPWWSLVATALVITLLFFLALPTKEWSTIARIAARCALIAAFPFCLVGLRVIRFDSLFETTRTALKFFRRRTGQERNLDLPDNERVEDDIGDAATEVGKPQS